MNVIRKNYLPEESVAKIHVYTNPSDHEVMNLRNTGIQLETSPHSDDTPIEMLAMIRLTEDGGEPKQLINEVCVFYDPWIAELSYEQEYLRDLPQEAIDISSTDPTQRLEQQIKADRALAKFEADNDRQLACGRLIRGLESEKLGWIRLITDKAVERCSYVLEGALKAGSIDFRQLGSLTSEYRACLNAASDMFVSATADHQLDMPNQVEPSNQFPSVEVNPFDVTPIITKKEADYDKLDIIA